MKNSDFITLLVRLQDLYLELRCNDHAASIDLLVPLLNSSPATTVLTFTKKINALSFNQSNNAGEELEHITSALLPAQKLLQDWGKPAVLKDLKLIIDTLQKTNAPSIADLIENLSRKKPKKAKKTPQPIREDLIETLNTQLEDALGDDVGFKAIYKNISENDLLTTKELTALSKRFTLRAPRGKKAALKSIWDRHQNIILGRAKSAATDGRIAG